MNKFTPSTSLFPELAGSVVVLAGGASGIGASTARLLVSHGAHVFVGDISNEDSKSLKAELKSGLNGSAEFVQCDIKNYKDIYNLFRRAYDQHGRVDHAINSVGILEVGRYLSDESLTVNTVGDDPGDTIVLDTNLYGSARFARIAVVFLKQSSQGQDSNKTLTILSSVGGLRDSPGVPLYQTSKVGLLGLLRGLRHLPWAKPTDAACNPRIRANVLCPGITDTPHVAHLTPPFKSSAGKAHWQTPESVAEVIAAVLVGGTIGGQEKVRLFGKSLYVEGGRAFEIEEGLQRERAKWMGEEAAGLLQANVDFIRNLGGIRKADE